MANTAASEVTVIEIKASALRAATDVCQNAFNKAVTRVLIERLIHTTEEERRRWPAMGEGRADIVIAGALAVRELISRFPSEALVCSTQGLRYGLARLAAEEELGSNSL